jgi:hypothetical protein
MLADRTRRVTQAANMHDSTVGPGLLPSGLERRSTGARETQGARHGLLRADRGGPPGTRAHAHHGGWGGRYRYRSSTTGKARRADGERKVDHRRAGCRQLHGRQRAGSAGRRCQADCRARSQPARGLRPEPGPAAVHHYRSRPSHTACAHHHPGMPQPGGGGGHPGPTAAHIRGRGPFHLGPGPQTGRRAGVTAPGRPGS